MAGAATGKSGEEREAGRGDGRSSRRLFLLDYDGTLLPAAAVSTQPSEAVLDILRRLTADPANDVYIISGRGRNELGTWFQPVVRCPQPTQRVEMHPEHGSGAQAIVCSGSKLLATWQRPLGPGSRAGLMLLRDSSHPPFSGAARRPSPCSARSSPSLCALRLRLTRLLCLHHHTLVVVRATQGVRLDSAAPPHHGPPNHGPPHHGPPTATTISTPCCLPAPAALPSR